MLRWLMLWLIVPLSLLGKTGPEFNQYFIDKTMRVDFYFTGTHDSCTIMLDQVIEEPIWAGSVTNLVDTLNLGAHLVKILEAQSKTLLYSRGFCSLFQEWQTTAEALSGMNRAIPASVLFPYPLNPVILELYSRDKKNIFIKQFETTIDPASQLIRRDKPRGNFKVKSYLQNGSPYNKVDILILPEGYTKREMRQFRKDVKHFMQVFFNAPPFREFQQQFNVWYLEVPSEESGIDDPRKGVFVKSAFEFSYNSFETDRYILGFENQRIRDIAANAPYDQLYFLINSPKYGGGGIFNLYSTCYNHSENEESSWWPDYVFVHEFGHAFGGLADEYYSSEVAYSEFYPPGTEPWEPNITICTDKDQLKWRELVDDSTPIPTPWEKALYDKIPYKDSKSREELLRNQEYWGKVGTFKGAGYASEGLYRPFLDCRMFSKTLINHCPVCSTAIVRVIKFDSE
jgi:hypothetical protein